MGRCCKNSYSSSIDAFLKNVQWVEIYIHIWIYLYVCINICMCMCVYKAKLKNELTNKSKENTAF